MKILRQLEAKVRKRLRQYRPDPSTQRFIHWCRARFPQTHRVEGDRVILIGLWDFAASTFCNAVVLNHLARREHAALVGCHFVGPKTRVTEKVFASFGARLGLSLADAAPWRGEARRAAREIAASLRTKRDLLEVHFDTLHVGDMLYDTYLRQLNVPTVDLADPRLEQIIENGLLIFHACRDFFRRKQVVALFCDDYGYINNGIPTRVATELGVPVYHTRYGPANFQPMRLGPMPEGRGHPVWCPYWHYPEFFAAFTPEQQAERREIGRETIEKRLAGQLCHRTLWTVTAYGEKTAQPALTDSGRPRILVLLHDFIDAPHGYRRMLFPDFHEWIHFLLERAGETPFDWIVKPHPGSYSTSGKPIERINGEILQGLKTRFPKVKFLDPFVSNRQLVEEGISAMFTVHGTAGHEFAYLGVPVVNAGDNPHIRYDFNLHAQTIEEYERYIRAADRLKVKVNHEDIYEFIYMHYFFSHETASRTASPIPEEIFESPDFHSRLKSSHVYDSLIAAATPEREKAVAGFLDEFFDHPESCCSVTRFGPPRGLPGERLAEPLVAAKS